MAAMVALMFAIQCQSPIPGGQQDPFSTYPHFPTKLYWLVILDDLEVVSLSWVTSHFVHWVIGSEYVIILSLCQVST